MTFAPLKPRKDSSTELNSLQKMVDAALSHQSIRDVALAVMCPKSDEQKMLALNAFAPSSEPHSSFQKLVDLAALFVASGYYRSAFQTLEQAAGLSRSPTPDAPAQQLPLLAKRMLQGTKELGAYQIHTKVKDLFEKGLPISLPEQEVTPSFDLQHGRIVNKLRSDNTPETIAEAEKNATHVVDDLIKNKVFPLVIDFIGFSLKHGEETKTHGILDKDCYQATVEKLTSALDKDPMLHACRWHLDHITNLYAQHALYLSHEA